MSKRIMQFYRAATAKVTTDDLRFVKKWLPAKEMPLFLKMSTIDQRHTINVARTAMIVANNYEVVDMALLVRAALLHDCGRENGMLGLFAKVWAVFLDKIFGYRKLNGFINRKPKPALVYIHRILNVYYNHPYWSANKVSALDSQTNIASIIRTHHKPASVEDTPEEACLKIADALN